MTLAHKCIRAPTRTSLCRCSCQLLPVPHWAARPHPSKHTQRRLRLRPCPAPHLPALRLPALRLSAPRLSAPRPPPRRRSAAAPPPPQVARALSPRRRGQGLFRCEKSPGVSGKTVPLCQRRSRPQRFHGGVVAESAATPSALKRRPAGQQALPLQTGL